MSKTLLLCSLLMLLILSAACALESSTQPSLPPSPPSSHSTATMIPTSSPPTATPTSPPPTATPQPAATPPALTLDDFSGPSFAPPLQRWLNAGGNPAALETMLNAIIAVPAEKIPIRSQVNRVDVTGDGIDEVALTLTIPRGGNYIDTSVLVLTPRAGHYETILEFIHAPLETLTDADGYRFLTIVDMNHSGIKEMVVDLAVGSDHRFWLIGWDGEQMRSLLAPQKDPLTLETVDYIFVPNGTGLVRDVDGDGLLELYTIRYRPEGEGPRHCGAKDVWHWDGTVFRHVHRIS